MKKFLFILLFFFCFSFQGMAQTIANANLDNNISAIKSIDKCWECKLVEGIYTYTFNFVYKMYNIISPVVYTLVLVFFSFWILWFIWNKLIHAHIDFKGANIFDLLKDFWKKIFTILFVLTLLTKVSAPEIFSYTIDPIISFGAGFGKWILLETRNENITMQSYNNVITNKSLPKYDCSNIQLSSKTISMLKANNINDEMNVDTLKNIICITGEYSNTYNIGLNFGAKIMSKGLIGLASDLGLKQIRKIANSLTSFIPKSNIWGNIIYVLAKVILFVIYISILIGMVMNGIISIIGLFVIIMFLYVGLTFLITILDLIIQLALVGVMMPIIIGSWAFDKEFLNLRGKLSGKLFWSVLRCSFRIAFLAVSVSISIFFFNELMTTTFDVDTNHTMLSLYDVIQKSSNATNLLKLLLSNMGLFIAMIFTVLASWMLLQNSISKADSFANSLYSGFSDDNIFNGLKQLTLSSIKYIMSGVKRENDFYFKKHKSKDIVDNIKTETERKSKISEWENQVFNEGNSEHLLDIPAEDVVKEYEKIRDNLNEVDETSESVFPETKEDSENRKDSFIAPIEPNIKQNIEVLESLQQPEVQFIENQLNSPEYKELSQEKKQEMATIILSDNPNELKSFAEDSEVSDMFASIELTTKEGKEVVNDELVLSNIIATETKSSDDLSNPIVKLQSIYIRQEVINEIEALPPKERNLMKKFMKLTKKPNVSNPENKKEYDKQKQIYEKIENKVKYNFALKKKKIDKLIEQRNNLQKTNKAKSILTAKNVIIAIKTDELNDIKSELKNVNFNDAGKRFQLRRRLKKLETELIDISEKDSFELEDEYDNIVEKWRKSKVQNKSKINPLKKL